MAVALPTPLLEVAAPELSLLAALAIRLATEPVERLAFTDAAARVVLRAAGFAAALRVTLVVAVFAVVFLATVFLGAAFLATARRVLEVLAFTAPVLAGRVRWLNTMAHSSSLRLLGLLPC